MISSDNEITSSLVKAEPISAKRMHASTITGSIAAKGDWRWYATPLKLFLFTLERTVFIETDPLEIPAEVSLLLIRLERNPFGNRCPLDVAFSLCEKYSNATVSVTVFLKSVSFSYLICWNHFWIQHAPHTNQLLRFVEQEQPHQKVVTHR